MARGKAIFHASALQVGDIVGAYTLLFTYKDELRRYWILRCNECVRERRVRDDHMHRYVGQGCMCKHIGTRHGFSRLREYAIWRHMLDRCHNESCDSYHWYGGVGRYVCERWRHSFENFLRDVGRAPTEGHSLDRIETTGSYTCGKCEECAEKNATANCRWATRAVQARNQTSNRYYTHGGKTLILKDWSTLSGINYLTLHDRLSRGWDFETAITKPIRPIRGVHY